MLNSGVVFGFGFIGYSISYLVNEIFIEGGGYINCLREDCGFVIMCYVM